jgi:hypothetical protein
MREKGFYIIAFNVTRVTKELLIEALFCANI